MRTTAPSLSLAVLLLAVLAAVNSAIAVPPDVCERQRADYPKRLRGDLSGDPVFFMDNANPQPDSPDGSAFYNKAPRTSVFKGATYTCEPVK